MTLGQVREVIIAQGNRGFVLYWRRYSPSSGRRKSIEITVKKGLSGTGVRDDKSARAEYGPFVVVVVIIQGLLSTGFFFPVVQYSNFTATLAPTGPDQKFGVPHISDIPIPPFHPLSIACLTMPYTVLCLWCSLLGERAFGPVGQG